jgi:hypothetical protein
MFMADIYCAQVPSFVPEEVQHVDRVQEVQDQHRVGDIAESVVLRDREDDINQRPREDARTTVEEQLEVERVRMRGQARIVLDALPEEQTYAQT